MKGFESHGDGMTRQRGRGVKDELLFLIMHLDA